MEEIKIPRYAEIKDKVLNNYIANVNSRNLPEDIDYEFIYTTNKSGVLYQASSASAFTPLLLQYSNDFFNLNDVVSFAIQSFSLRII